MPGMPVLVNSILAAVPKLADVVMVLSLLVVVLGIAGTSLFQGTMHYRCAKLGYVEPQIHPSLLVGDPHAVSMDGTYSSSARGLEAKGAFEHPSAAWDTDMLCDPTAVVDVCPSRHAIGDPDASEATWRCMYFEETPNADITSFDHFYTSVIIVLQTLTFDEWATPMYDLMDATRTPLVVVFWLISVLFGGFFLVNLFLAVLFQEFVEAQARERAFAEHRAARIQALAARRSERFRAANVIQRRFKWRKGGGDSMQRRPTRWKSVMQKFRSDEERKVLKDIAGGVSDLEKSLGDEGTESSPSDYWDCTPAAGSCRSQLADVMTSPWVSNTSIGLVLVNLVLMCMPYYGMPQDYGERLETYATAISWVFIVEMALKITGFGCVGYWQDGWNTLDGIIVSLSIVEMVLTALFSGSGVKLSFLRILRMLRVARVLRLMRAWKGLYKIVSTIVQALPQLSNVLILLTLVSTIFALLGMQLFGGKFTDELGYGEHPEQTPLPRYHFDYFVPAMLTVFIVMTGDAWVSPMMDGISVLGPQAAVFYIVVVLIGTYLMMNLLVAVLLHLFSQKSDAEISSVKGDCSQGANSEINSSAKVKSDEDVHIMRADDYALGCFAPDDPFRRRCRAWVESPTVDALLTATVVASSLTLTLDTPRVDPSSGLSLLLGFSNYLFTAAFAAEAGAKVVGLGFVATPNACKQSGTAVQ